MNGVSWVERLELCVCGRGWAGGWGRDGMGWEGKGVGWLGWVGGSAGGVERGVADSGQAYASVDVLVAPGPLFSDTDALKSEYSKHMASRLLPRLQVITCGCCGDAQCECKACILYVRKVRWA